MSSGEEFTEREVRELPRDLQNELQPPIKEGMEICQSNERKLPRDIQNKLQPPIKEGMEICQSDDPDTESGKYTVITENAFFLNSGSNVVNDNMTKDLTSSYENKTCEPHNILEFDPPNISMLSECIL